MGEFFIYSAYKYIIRHMICKCFLPVCGFFFSFPISFLGNVSWTGQGFQFWWSPFYQLVPLWIVLSMLYLSIFFFMFSSQSFIVWVLHFFANWYHLFGPICWRGYLFATELPFHFCWKSVNIRVGLYLDCIVFHWSLCLSLCQYHSVLMAIIL